MAFAEDCTVYKLDFGRCGGYQCRRHGTDLDPYTPSANRNCPSFPFQYESLWRGAMNLTAFSLCLAPRGSSKSRTTIIWATTFTIFLRLHIQDRSVVFTLLPFVTCRDLQLHRSTCPTTTCPAQDPCRSYQGPII